LSDPKFQVGIVAPLAEVAARARVPVARAIIFIGFFIVIFEWFLIE
jgi:hypothetical protein